MMRHLFWLMGLLLFGLVGCGSSKDADLMPDLSPDEMYRQALQAVKDEHYKKATRFFTELDQKHPFSPWAVRAQLNLIFTNYKLEEYDEAIGHADRFIRLHPRHAEVAYTYYMRGLAHYKRIRDAYRDQDRTREAATAFREVINRFPQSDYAWEAKNMLNFCRNRMAQQEVVIGRYYFDRNEFIAAGKRFALLVENTEFRDTPQTEEALFMQVLVALKLELPDQARNYASVLGHNFKNGRYYALAKEIIEGKAGIRRSEIKELRREIHEDSILEQFMEGMRPGMPIMGN
uniref:Outer membrane protein assembly factor BamD n=1 Tax=Magnetococcus massalia (strain MO-1) TaxID=451514 RepID=A0A1S7LKD4_MAGMO|nr:putative lipoprotein [Candidatus Magnetococcus massalia]